MFDYFELQDIPDCRLYVTQHVEEMIERLNNCLKFASIGNEVIYLRKKWRKFD